MAAERSIQRLKMGAVPERFQNRFLKRSQTKPASPGFRLKRLALCRAHNFCACGRKTLRGFTAERGRYAKYRPHRMLRELSFAVYTPRFISSTASRMESAM